MVRTNSPSVWSLVWRRRTENYGNLKSVMLLKITIAGGLQSQKDPVMKERQRVPFADVLRPAAKSVTLL